MDSEEIARIQAMMDTERAQCELCKEEGWWIPRHFRCSIYGGRLVSNADCGSNSRRYDPQTGEFIGHSHCTCDFCF